ncbi:MAG: SipW-dependent-type signal peptide-containing protein [Firmicutes bacterium]|nr:SipW-dependent-type signal peptide-containing protein [Bacillota bacterium]
MTNSKSTKRALLTSVLALLMCVTMLVGATFAWFTDTASTEVNKIQAGNLDLEVQYRTTANGEWNTLDNATDLFGAEGTLFEPGHTRVVELKITNAGTLALKYKIGMNVVSETAGTNKDSKPYKLSDYLKVAATGIQQYPAEGGIAQGMEWAIFQPGMGSMWKSHDFANFYLEYASNGNVHVLQPGAAQILGIKVYMPESVGNEANAKTPADAASINFGLNVVATQYTTESDSYGNTYDKDAKYPDVAYTQASTQEELNAALNNPTDANGSPTSKIAINLNRGSYTLPGSQMSNKEISIAGTEDTVIDLKAGTAAHNASITMEGVTVESTNGNYTGIQHAAATTFKDCVIKGQPFLYAKDVQYINCTFEQDSSSAYNVWTYGAGNVLFKDCTFNCAGKSVLIYNEGSINGQTVEFQNCKFNASALVAGKAAIEIDSSLLPDGGAYKVIIDQATADNVTGFDSGSVSQNSLWNNKKGTKATVIVAGTTVLSAS